MKKTTLLAAIALSLCASRASASVEVNDSTFPDNYFQTYVLSTFDTDHDEELSDSEIAAAKTITANNKKITSLKGIEYLTALTSLSATNNRIESVDLSKNTELTTVKLSNNLLTGIDLSKLTNLTTLDLRSNPKLKSVDLTHNVALASLTLSSD